MTEPVVPTSSTVTTVASFEAFCANEHDRLARALALAFDHRELGRDAAAEALARAWERWREVSTYDNPAGWAYRVGLNWGRSRLRRRRREMITALVPELGGVEPAADNRHVLEALRHLSTDHRAVIVGRFYLDWSEAELASALGIPAGTAKSRLSRALQQLERHLDHGGHDG